MGQAARTKSVDRHSIIYTRMFQLLANELHVERSVHTLGHLELTQFCQYTGDKLIMILQAIHSPEVETSSYDMVNRQIVVPRVGPENQCQRFGFSS